MPGLTGTRVCVSLSITANGQICGSRVRPDQTCAAPSSAAPAPAHAPEPGGRLSNKIAAAGNAEFGQTSHSSRAGRSNTRKYFCCDYPRGSLSPRQMPPFCPRSLSVAAALRLPLVFAVSSRAVGPLRLPPRPLPRFAPTVIAAIARPGPARSKLLFAAFQEAEAQTGATSSLLCRLSVWVLICAPVRRILGGAHGRWCSQRLKSRRGSPPSGRLLIRRLPLRGQNIPDTIWVEQQSSRLATPETPFPLGDSVRHRDQASQGM